MSRLGNILNAIITPFGKTLWEGSASSGTITVPDTSKYLLFAVTIGGETVVCARTGNVITGSLLTSDTAGSQYSKSIYVALNGNAWSLTTIKELSHKASSNHGAASGKAITKIVGLIPNWGGGTT